MEKTEILKLIKTRKIWDSNELIELINSKIEVTFCRIYGYEGMKDGTIEYTFSDLESIQEYLSDMEIEYDESITDIIELVKSIEEEYEDHCNDGGGSGWIGW